MSEIASQQLLFHCLKYLNFIFSKALFNEYLWVDPAVFIETVDFPSQQATDLHFAFYY